MPGKDHVSNSYLKKGSTSLSRHDFHTELFKWHNPIQKTGESTVLVLYISFDNVLNNVLNP